MAERNPAMIFFLLMVLTTFQSGATAQVNNENPQFVFVHGIGHGAWCFAPLITLLQQAGYTATAVDLASHGIDKAVADDVVTIAQYLKPLTALFETVINKPTILAGHSLAGAVISVVAEMFPRKVAKAVFLAGVYPSNNNTFFNALPPSTLNRLVGDGNLILQGSPVSTSAVLNIRNLTDFFYNRSPKMAVNLASTLLVPTPYRPGIVPISLTKEKFGATRKFYVKTLADLGITPEEQQEMIDASPWAPERVYRVPNADHAVYYSQTASLARILVEIAETPQTKI